MHRMRIVVVMAVVAAASGTAMAQKWQDATASCLGTTAEWTNKVEVADVDGDGKIDLLLANGGTYQGPGMPSRNEAARVFKNTWGDTTNCSEISAQAVGGFVGMSRMIKAADIDGDGDLDILTGGAWQSQLKLSKREGSSWTDATAQLPQQLTAIGDAEFGDVDNDGDLDIVLAEIGTDTIKTGYAGGRTRLYLNDGHGTFTDATAAQMPDTLVKWSWDIEFADVDNDWDLDILVSCKLCTTSYLFRNDGTGHFTNDPDALPHFTNNYEFEPMDIDHDGDLDLITINDGPNVTERLFVNRGDGTFADETTTRLTGTANPANADDNVAVWLDYDSDGDPDLVIGSLGDDRLLENDGTGKFTLVAGGAEPAGLTDSTLGLAVADFDGDGRIDIVDGQGESLFPDKVLTASMGIAVDNKPPVIRVAASLAGNVLTARVHDRIGPSHTHDFTKVVVMAGTTEIPMTWYGEMLWRASIPIEAMASSYQVCATDRQGNMACASNTPSADDGGITGDGGDVNPPGKSGGCCDTGSDQRGAALLVLVTALGSVRRRRARNE